jgi:hypothetical protein
VGEDAELVVAAALDPQHARSGAHHLRRLLGDALGEPSCDEPIAPGIDQNVTELRGEEVQAVVRGRLGCRRAEGAPEVVLDRFPPERRDAPDRRTVETALQRRSLQELTEAETIERRHQFGVLRWNGRVVVGVEDSLEEANVSRTVNFGVGDDPPLAEHAVVRVAAQPPRLRAVARQIFSSRAQSELAEQLEVPLLAWILRIRSGIDDVRRADRVLEAVPRFQP